MNQLANIEGSILQKQLITRLIYFLIRGTKVDRCLWHRKVYIGMNADLKILIE